MQTLELQRRLKALGFDPGPIDGIPGRLTAAGVRAFQAARGLPQTGIADAATVRALAAVDGKPATAGGAPPWYEEGLRRKGLHEVRDRSTLMSWLRSDGRTLGDPSKLPWCGDFVETAILLTLPDEPVPSNPYGARNWGTFGVGLETPALGAILTFWRGSPSGWQGHVGFYAGEDATTYSVLGGNQSNAITIARLAKNRLLAIRWPATWPLPAGGRVSRTGGVLSTNEA